MHHSPIKKSLENTGISDGQISLAKQQNLSLFLFSNGLGTNYEQYVSYKQFSDKLSKEYVSWE